MGQGVAPCKNDLGRTLDCLGQLALASKRIILVLYKQRFKGVHLGFHDGREGYKVANVSSAFVDLKNMCFDTKKTFSIIFRS